MRPLNRIAPQLPAQSMKTYEIVAPEPTHFRDATCAEVDCEVQASGWITSIDETTDLGARQAHYIRRMSGRAFTESHTAGITEFTFPAGEECFKQHKVRLDRQELYVVRGGDWRGNPRREVFQHGSAEAWVEDFAEHQDRLDKASG